MNIFLTIMWIIVGCILLIGITSILIAWLYFDEIYAQGKKYKNQGGESDGDKR